MHSHWKFRLAQPTGKSVRLGSALLVLALGCESDSGSKAADDDTDTSTDETGDLGEDSSDGDESGSESEDDGCEGFPAGTVFDAGTTVFNVDDDAELLALQGIRCVAARAFDISGVTNLQPLSDLEVVEGSLYIRQNPTLATLEPLGSLRAVGATFSVDANPALTSLDGLQALASVPFVHIGESGDLNEPGPIAGRGNDALVDLGGLETLSVEYLLIGDNEALTSLDGLSQLQQAGSVHIVNNAKLPVADAAAFADRVHDGNDTLVCGNLGGEACMWGTD